MYTRRPEARQALSFTLKNGSASAPWKIENVKDTSLPASILEVEREIRLSLKPEQQWVLSRTATLNMKLPPGAKTFELTHENLRESDGRPLVLAKGSWDSVQGGKVTDAQVISSRKLADIEDRKSVV